MSVRLGNGNWAVSSSKLLAYNDAAGPFFNKEFDFTRATSATRYNKSSLIESVDNNIARIDFLGSSEGHLLLEPASTNKIPNSENVGDGKNSPQKMDRTLNVAVAPDGTTTADLCIPNTQSASHQAYQFRDDDTSTSFVSGSNYAWSVFVKSNPTNGAQFVQMATFISTGGSDKVNFDIVNGTITQTGFESSKIENYGNGWFRCSIVFAALRDSSAGGSDGWSLNSITAGDSGRAESFAGDGSSNGVLVWGAQFEEVKDFATSYIPTAGASVTRNAETCNGSGAEQDFNSLEGVIYLEIAAIADDQTFKEISISDSSEANEVLIRTFHTSANIYNARITANSSVESTMINTLSDITQFNKIALKYKSGDIGFFINGVKVVTNTSTFTFTNNLNQLRFEDGGGGGDFYGKVRDLRVFTKALTDTELITLTT